ncbi:MAG: ferric iron reductase [Chloroflexota bacterium]
METEHPLQATFSRVKELSEYVKVELGTPTDAGWVEPPALFTPSSEKMNTLMVNMQKRLKTKSTRIVGSSLLQAYNWPLIAASIACYLVDKRVPDLSVSNIRVQFSDEEEVTALAFHVGRFAALPSDPAAFHPDAQVVPDIAALRACLRSGFETHFGWVITQIEQQVGAKPKGLWLDVADLCASILIWFMQDQDPKIDPELIKQEIDSLIREPDSPLNHKKIGLFTLTYAGKTEAYLDRLSCCYWYRWEESEGKYCTTCPKVPKAERKERLLQYMIEAHEKAESGETEKH